MGKERICIEKREERIIRTKRIYMEIEGDFLQMYKNLDDYTGMLKSPWSMKFLIWLVTQISNDNKVNIDSELKKEYIDSRQKKGVEPPSLRTIDYVVRELKENNILLHVGRGVYKINPVLFWQSTREARRKHIEFLREGGEFTLEPVITKEIKSGSDDL